MSYQFRQALCNELYEKRSLADTCKSVRKIGYSGIEIAPFTLAEDATAIPAEKRREYRSIIESEGLRFAGLHGLLVSPKGLHVAAADKAVRERSWDFLRRLIDFCADLGPRGVMVFGSPKQRGSSGGLSTAEAKKYFIGGLAGLALHAVERGVSVLVEALSKEQTDVVNTVDEAAEIVKTIGSHGIRTMFDTHNAVDETEPHDEVVNRHFELIRHIHVNEMDGRHPGTGNYDFKPLLRVLKRRNYDGWVSLEAFDFTPGAEKVATESLRFLEAEIARL